MLSHMAMLAYNEVLPKRLIIIDGEPYEVLSAWVFRKQQRKPVNQVKLRNLKTGSMAEHTYHVSDKIEEAEVESRPAVFIYERNGEWFFHEVTDKSKRFTIDQERIGDASKYLKSNVEVEVRWFDNEPMQVKIPIKMDLKVTEAPPNTRGNTAQGGNKVVTLETGATLNVPMFVEAGDTVRINTETGDYVERV
ncbi:MAG: efp, elongation factor elongation factor [Candidatus Kaiserbacteria bacterium]|nr:efp, elongation factor elongation factor [Candidatus Kaiserbacteria bacterium]